MADFSFRKKIKGFHLAFNIRAKLDKASKYKFVPQDGTAAEIVARNTERKKKRLEVQALREKAGQDKFKQERAQFRIHAEQLRKKKQQELQDQLLSGGDENSYQSIREKKRINQPPTRAELLAIKK